MEAGSENGKNGNQKKYFFQHDEEPSDIQIEIPEVKSCGKFENSIKQETVKESEELVVHFVSNPEKFEDPAKRNFNW